MRELADGSVFAGHRIEEVAGRGGMGVVYRATQLALDRTVALKVVAPDLLNDESVRSRFVRESKAAASIDHPNVIPIHHAGEEDGIAYITMRYIAGDDVRSLVRREGPLDPERAARIIAQTGAALDAAHAAGLVHRDVKPANVLLGPDDHVYLSDFGLTKHAVSVAGTTRPGHWVGTLDYVAPEQIRGERVDARADVYALGCVLFYVLTGRVPFDHQGDEAKLWAHLSAPPPKPTQIVPAVPAGLDEVVERALAKQPDARYQSAGHLGRMALAAAAGRPVSERERLVATGAAAPAEAETLPGARPVTSVAAARELQPATGGASEAETLRKGAPRAPGRRRPIAAVTALAVLVVAGGGVALTLVVGSDPKEPVPPERRTTTATAATDRLAIAGTIAVGNRPNTLAVGHGNVFVGSFRRQRLTVLDAARLKRRAISPDIGVGVSDTAVSGPDLFVTVARQRRLVHLDARTSRRRGATTTFEDQPTSLAITRSNVWVGTRTSVRGAPDSLYRVERATGRVNHKLAVPFGISRVAGSPGSLWVANRQRASVTQVDTVTGRVRRRIRVGSSIPEDVAYGSGGVWVASPGDDSVFRIDPRTGNVIGISVGSRPRQLTVSGGRVYATNFNGSTLTVIDARRPRVVGSPVDLPLNPYAVAASGGSVWVTSPGEDKVVRLRDRGG